MLVREVESRRPSLWLFAIALGFVASGLALMLTAAFALLVDVGAHGTLVPGRDRIIGAYLKGHKSSGLNSIEDYNAWMSASGSQVDLTLRNGENLFNDGDGEYTTICEAPNSMPAVACGNGAFMDYDGCKWGCVRIPGGRGAQE